MLIDKGELWNNMRLIDADKLTPLWMNNEDGLPITGAVLIDDILNAPTVDAVPVVRCRDCKHYYADPWGYGNCVFEGGVSRRTKDSDFCSWGERREEDGD